MCDGDSFSYPVLLCEAQGTPIHGVSPCYGVILFYGVNLCFGVIPCYGIIPCYGVSRCCGVSPCYGICLCYVTFAKSNGFWVLRPLLSMVFNDQGPSKHLNGRSEAACL